MEPFPFAVAGSVHANLRVPAEADRLAVAAGPWVEFGLKSCTYPARVKMTLPLTPLRLTESVNR
jgi:hypothetical protein